MKAKPTAQPEGEGEGEPEGEGSCSDAGVSGPQGTTDYTGGIVFYSHLIV